MKKVMILILMFIISFGSGWRIHRFITSSAQMEKVRTRPESAVSVSSETTEKTIAYSTVRERPEPIIKTQQKSQPQRIIPKSAFSKNG